MVKNLPAMQETWVQSLGQKDLMEKGIAIHSRTLAWRILWTAEPGKLQSIGSQRVGYNWATNIHEKKWRIQLEVFKKHNKRKKKQGN